MDDGRLVQKNYNIENTVSLGRLTSVIEGFVDLVRQRKVKGIDLATQFCILINSNDVRSFSQILHRSFAFLLPDKEPTWT